MKEKMWKRISALFFVLMVLFLTISGVLFWGTDYSERIAIKFGIGGGTSPIVNI